MARTKTQKKPKSAAIISPTLTPDKPPQVIGDGQPPISPLITLLEAYRIEAWAARISGRNPREVKWRENLDLYWNRFDFSKKARWQSTAILPEVPGFVDRFCAAIMEGLVNGAGNGEFYTVEDPADVEDDMGPALKRVMDVWLSQCGRLPNGHPLSFFGIFPDILKLGALMNCAAQVVWKDTSPTDGYVAVEPIDPRAVWLDHTNRGLYRIRRIEIDKHELLRLARLEDAKGNPIYNLEQIENLASYLRVEMQEEQRRLTGTGVEQTSWRKPITLDEYLCTIVDTDGQVVATNAIVVVANERFIIRGPEENPFWHHRDWIVYTPLVTVPLSPYGRSYMENMGSLARLFNDLTNLIMDAVYTSAIKAFAVKPSNLEDPTQIDEGLYPNLMLRVSEDGDPKGIFHSIDLGQVPQDVVLVWQNLKAELREAGNFNELSAGQMAPKGRTSATEVATAQNNGTALMRDIARTIETRLIEPILDLVWKTGLQHMKKGDKKLAEAAGEKWWPAIYAQRKELASGRITFQCRAITTMLQKQAKLKTLLQMLGIVQQNPMMLQEFLKVADLGKLLKYMLKLDDIDIEELELSQRELMMKELTQMQQPQPNPAEPGGGQAGGPQTGNVPQSAAGPQGGTPPQTTQDMLAGMVGQ